MSDGTSAARAVGHQVRVAIVEHGQNQTAVALAVGMTIDAMSRRVSGRVSFRADELVAVAEFLGVEPARFFRPVPEPRVRDEPQAAAAAARGAA